jgi:hypothetical protein
MIQFIDKKYAEYLEIMKLGEQDPSNLDKEPPKMPATDSEEKKDENYVYYDKLTITQSSVLFRYFVLNYLQKPNFDQFLKKEMYCVVTINRDSMYDPTIFEKKVKDVYDL